MCSLLSRCLWAAPPARLLHSAEAVLSHSSEWIQCLVRPASAEPATLCIPSHQRQPTITPSPGAWVLAPYGISKLLDFDNSIFFPFPPNPSSTLISSFYTFSYLVNNVVPSYEFLILNSIKITGAVSVSWLDPDWYTADNLDSCVDTPTILSVLQ